MFKYHKTTEGIKIPIACLEDEHLINIIHFLIRWNRLHVLDPYIVEANIRGLDVTESLQKAFGRSSQISQEEFDKLKVAAEKSVYGDLEHDTGIEAGLDHTDFY